MALILIVDDSVNNRILLTAILESAGHAIVQAAGGDEALRLAEAAPPKLVITDMHMPGLSGVAFVTALRALPRMANVPVALYTATAEDAALRTFTEITGIEGIIPKPSEPAVVLAEVDRLLSSG
jgi:two-component system chemotaxis response regulator CheY